MMKVIYKRNSQQQLFYTICVIRMQDNFKRDIVSRAEIRYIQLIKCLKKFNISIRYFFITLFIQRIFRKFAFQN